MYRIVDAPASNFYLTRKVNHPRLSLLRGGSSLSLFEYGCFAKSVRGTRCTCQFWHSVVTRATKGRHELTHVLRYSAPRYSP